MLYVNCMLSCLIFITPQRERCYYGSFPRRETEAPGNANNFPKGTWQVSEGPRVQTQATRCHAGPLYSVSRSFSFFPSNSQALVLRFFSGCRALPGLGRGERRPKGQVAHMDRLREDFPSGPIGPPCGCHRS